MSLKDRLKKSKTEITEQKSDTTPETSVEKNYGVLNIRDRISSLLYKKISSTPKWQDYSDKKQEGYAIDFITEQLSVNFPALKVSRETISRIVKEILVTTKDFGMLEDLLRDDEINYIMVNGADSIYVEKNNKLIETNLAFKNPKDLRRFIDNLSLSAGITINEKNPVLDFYHKRGYHINILIPPAVSKEPCITIKKINFNLCSLEDLLKNRTMSLEMAKMLEYAVISGANIIVAGLKESGKTTILNSLCKKIPQTERVILIEDVEELNIEQKNIIRLKTQPVNNVSGNYQITPLNLIKNSIRMRPDRIVLGECMGDEAYEFMHAMKTGYLGLMTTLYANSVSDSLMRLESLILNCSKLSPAVIRDELVNSIDLIVYVQKMPSGERKIVRISEPVELEDGTTSTQDIFVWQKQTDYGGIAWEHISTGIVPRFLDKAKENGFEINNIIFDKKYTHTYPKD